MAAERRCFCRKRAGKEQQQESSKRQRIEDDKDEHEEVEEYDEAELKKHLVILKDDEITMSAYHFYETTSTCMNTIYIQKEKWCIITCIKQNGSSNRYSYNELAFRTDDLDAFDSDCDEAPSASAVFMAKLSSCDSKIISEVPIHDNYLDNHVFDQNVQEMQYSEQPVFNNDIDIDITSDSNMISYEQYLKEIENTAKEDKYLNEIIELETKEGFRQCGLQNSNTIVKPHDALSAIDTEETLELAEESRLKMHAKQNDPIVKEKKVNIAPIDYVALNKLSENFVKHFVPQKKTFEIKEKELLLENDHLLELLISQDLMHTAVNSLAKIIDYQRMEKSFLDEYSECIELKDELSKRMKWLKRLFMMNFQKDVKEWKTDDAPEFPAFFEINKLKAQLKAKDNLISKSKYRIATLKGKSVSEGNKSNNIPKVIAPGMYKLDLEPLSPKMLRNREARADYLKHTQENADTLREIVKQARELRPLDSDLDSTYNGIEFVNQTLQAYYDEVGISHQTSVARTLQQNGAVKGWDRTLVKAARTMPIFSKASLFLLEEAVETACYTQNRSLI
ncbi:integrase, catalytic region, zinc finger, CCHC-type containing protein [Tanacetum coccineum]